MYMIKITAAASVGWINYYTNTLHRHHNSCVLHLQWHVTFLEHMQIHNLPYSIGHYHFNL